jgi:hypothetical protein
MFFTCISRGRVRVREGSSALVSACVNTVQCGGALGNVRCFSGEVGAVSIVRMLNKGTAWTNPVPMWQCQGQTKKPHPTAFYWDVVAATIAAGPLPCMLPRPGWVVPGIPLAGPSTLGNP